MAPDFTIQTDRLRLTWSGPFRGTEGEPLVARALGADGVSFNGGAAAGAVEAPVQLEEEAAYPVLVQSLDGAPVALRHRDPVVTAGLVEADGGRVVHGRVRFGSQAGRSRFVLTSGGRPEAEVDLTVAPTKLSAADVHRMREDVEAAAAGLALAALRPTTSDLVPEADESAPAGWLAALQAAAGALDAAVAEIARRPALDVVREPAMVRTDRVRRASSETRRALRQSGADAARLPARPAALTPDTPAHRWLARRLDLVASRLAHLVRDEAGRRPSARRDVLLAELDALGRRLQNVRARSPLVAARPEAAPDVPPLALRRQRGYADAYGALQALDRGLALRAGALDVATQDLAVLFEVWAALATVEAAADALGVEAPRLPFGVDVRGADVRLRRGRRHGVRLRGPAGEVEVVYNPRFPAPPALLVQRPDLWLTVRPRRGPARRVVLDAKYRRDDSAAYARRHGAAGPPEDALGTLHRYRDAVVGPGGETGWVHTAAALFPGEPSPAFFESRLWTSLGALGVGAVPLRPGRTEALRRFLSGLLGGP